MSEKNIEMMKKFIEAKKEKNSQKSALARPDKSIGGARKAKRNNKAGGFFDK